MPRINNHGDSLSDAPIHAEYRRTQAASTCSRSEGLMPAAGTISTARPNVATSSSCQPGDLDEPDGCGRFELDVHVDVAVGPKISA
jgi:hypothetical protein